MEREITPFIINDLNNKIVLITGPRQCGKTTLSKALFSNYYYLNYDLLEHRLEIKKKLWDRFADVVIFDELHKMSNWKSFLKGIFDTQNKFQKMLVTGSAKLETFRKIRLHPLTLKELSLVMPIEEAFDRLMNFGGFPEPFLKNNISFYKRWQKTHLNIILRQDLLDLESVKDISSIETLVELLRHRVGSSISYSSLARDLEKDPKTIKRWLMILENLYIIFKVTPFHKNAARMILKEPKYYFFDNAQVLGSAGARLENLVATSLKREIDFVEDTQGLNVSINFVKDKNGQEVDFMISIEEKQYLIEVKSSDDQPSKSLQHFSSFWPKATLIQLVSSLDREKVLENGLMIKKLAPWLSKLDFSNKE
jgi:predicted AAA+ superfamily ATPase